MTFIKFLVLAALVAVVYGNPAPAPAPMMFSSHSKVRYGKSGDGPAVMHIEEAEMDSRVGGMRARKEHRVGDQVKGTYALVGLDGTKKVVDYTKDNKNGFRTVVRD